MPPAKPPRAQAEVVLLAVALGEQVGAERPYRIQAGSPDIQTETHAHRYVDRTATVRAPGETIDALSRRAVRNRVAARRIGIAQDGRVVGQRRDRADVRCAIGDRPQLLQPSGGNQRVAVQQDHVVPGGGAHAGIGAGGEAAVAAVAKQRDAASPGERRQCSCQLRLRRGVVDDDETAGPPDIGQHAVQAGECTGGSAVHRHDDIHWRPAAGRCAQGLRGNRQCHRPRGFLRLAFGLRTERTAEQVLAVAVQHTQRTVHPGERGRRDHEAAWPGQQPGGIDRRVHVGRQQRDRPMSPHGADRQERIAARVAGTPCPARQPAILNRDAAGRRSDCVDRDRAA